MFLLLTLACEICQQNQGIFEEKKGWWVRWSVKRDIFPEKEMHFEIMNLLFYKQFWIIHKLFYMFSFYQKMEIPISLNTGFLKERKIDQCLEELSQSNDQCIFMFLNTLYFLRGLFGLISHMFMACNRVLSPPNKNTSPPKLERLPVLKMFNALSPPPMFWSFLLTNVWLGTKNLKMWI